MTHQTYILILCIFVFVLLTGLLGAMLYVLLKQGHKLIYFGHEDERIKIEYMKEQQSSAFLRAISVLLTLAILAAVLAGFVVSVFIQLNQNKPVDGIALPRVVLSRSMSVVNPKNTDLQKDGVDNQILKNDLIFIHAMPAESELELYDIVVYKDHMGDMVIHRIVGIEEPNAKHPNQRHFALRGDANAYNDQYPVLYEQMYGIYKDERIANVGSFFAFMQSPAGYLCILLIIIAVIATPILEKKLWEAKIARLKVIGFGPFAKYRRRRILRFSWKRVFWILFAMFTIPVVEHTLWRATLGRSRVMRKLFSPKRRTVHRGKR